MVKQTQTICQQFAAELFECVGPFCGVGASGVKMMEYQYHQYGNAKLLYWELYCDAYEYIVIRCIKARLDKTDFKLHSLMQSLLSKSRNGLLYHEK